MKLPPVNATLTRIARFEEENVGGEIVETEVEVWTGSAPAFTTEKNSIEAGPVGPMNLYAASIAIPYPLGDPAVEVAIGDELTYTRNGSEEARRITQTEDREDFGFTRCYVSEPD